MVNPRKTASQPPALRPLDAAVGFLRSHADIALPLYIVGVAPMSLAMLFIIDAVSAARYSALSEGAAMLALATVWKWIFSAATQARIQRKLTGAQGAPLRGRIVAIVCVKLAASVIMLWGSFIILPFIYGFFLSGLAAPILLDRDGAAVDEAEWILKWVSGAMNQAVKILSAIFVLFFIAELGFGLLQLVVTRLIMPSFLGMDPTELSLTLTSAAWNMAIIYILFLIFDFYWTVASVMLYYEIQSRRVGVDISARLAAMGG